MKRIFTLLILSIFITSNIFAEKIRLDAGQNLSVQTSFTNVPNKSLFKTIESISKKMKAKTDNTANPNKPHPPIQYGSIIDIVNEKNEDTEQDYYPWCWDKPKNLYDWICEKTINTGEWFASWIPWAGDLYSIPREAARENWKNSSYTGRTIKVGAGALLAKYGIGITNFYWVLPSLFFTTLYGFSGYAQVDTELKKQDNLFSKNLEHFLSLEKIDNNITPRGITHTYIDKNRFQKAKETKRLIKNIFSEIFFKDFTDQISDVNNLLTDIKTIKEQSTISQRLGNFLKDILYYGVYKKKDNLTGQQLYNSLLDDFNNSGFIKFLTVYIWGILNSNDNNEKTQKLRHNIHKILDIRKLETPDMYFRQLKNNLSNQEKLHNVIKLLLQEDTQKILENIFSSNLLRFATYMTDLLSYHETTSELGSKRNLYRKKLKELKQYYRKFNGLMNPITYKNANVISAIEQTKREQINYFKQSIEKHRQEAEQKTINQIASIKTIDKNYTDEITNMDDLLTFLLSDNDLFLHNENEPFLYFNKFTNRQINPENWDKETSICIPNFDVNIRTEKKVKITVNFNNDLLAKLLLKNLLRKQTDARIQIIVPTIKSQDLTSAKNLLETKNSRKNTYPYNPNLTFETSTNLTASENNIFYSNFLSLNGILNPDFLNSLNAAFYPGANIAFNRQPTKLNQRASEHPTIKQLIEYYRIGDNPLNTAINYFLQPRQAQDPTLYTKHLKTITTCINAWFYYTILNPEPYDENNPDEYKQSLETDFSKHIINLAEDFIQQENAEAIKLDLNAAQMEIDNKHMDIDGELTPKEKNPTTASSYSSPIKALIAAGEAELEEAKKFERQFNPNQYNINDKTTKQMKLHYEQATENFKNAGTISKDMGYSGDQWVLYNFVEQINYLLYRYLQHGGDNNYKTKAENAKKEKPGTGLFSSALVFENFQIKDKQRKIGLTPEERLNPVDREEITKKSKAKRPTTLNEFPGIKYDIFVETYIRINEQETKQETKQKANEILNSFEENLEFITNTVSSEKINEIILDMLKTNSFEFFEIIKLEKYDKEILISLIKKFIEKMKDEIEKSSEAETLSININGSDKNISKSEFFEALTIFGKNA